MPVIAAQPITIQNSALIGARPAPAVAPKASEDKSAAFAASLARADVYVNGAAEVAETAILSLFNSYQDTRGAVAQTQQTGTLAAGDFFKVGGSVKRSALQRVVTSTATNGWQLYRGKITLAEAGGRVVGDVSTAAVAGAAGGLASNLAVYGLTKAGAGSVPVMIGGMVASFAVNNVSRRVLNKIGVTEAIAHTTTQALQAMSVSKN